MKIYSPMFLLVLIASLLRADGTGDNLPDKVRKVPPPGLKIAEADRAELQSGAGELGKQIESLRADLKSKSALLELLPDVQIYHKAVQDALRYDEFFKSNEVQVARVLLEQGRQRLRQLRDGQTPWIAATGLVARGYLSRIDGSVQPYGLVVPPTFQPGTAHAFRLDFWFHGRGETLSELDFINGRQKSPGEFVPPNAFVLHLYGRYCNGNRFAGETDLFEALENVRKYYPIDENRLAVRGFSLGGAACWHFATHYAHLWAAAAPGAGFSETADFLKVFQKEVLQPTWYEQKLWHLYDATDYALNLFNCPTVAYSGENDSQKQAADMMVKALAEENLDLVHLIGPKMGHSYHPESKAEINRRLDSILARGRNPVPERVRFTTWTLRYNQMYWVTIDSLGQHWERARVDGELSEHDNRVRLVTKNVSALTLSMPPGYCPFDSTVAPKVEIDGQTFQAPGVRSDRSWAAHLRKGGETWVMVSSADEPELRKRHGLQGPIDDAFMESFLMVRPSGKPLNEAVGKWAAAELAHATNHWRQQFRGEARLKNDSDVTEADIAQHNLVLWGDPSSNQVLARLADKLPIGWNSEGIRLGKTTFPSNRHVPVFIYPNPLNPKKYIVLNSGFTFREYDYLNNARQVPKLPDFAVVDVGVPVTSRAPGGIASAGFFDELWQLPKN